MIVEHNSVVLERNGLQQQCTQAVHKWDITLRERKELQDALKKVQFSSDSFVWIAERINLNYFKIFLFLTDATTTRGSDEGDKHCYDNSCEDE